MCQVTDLSFRNDAFKAAASRVLGACSPEPTGIGMGLIEVASAGMGVNPDGRGDVPPAPPTRFGNTLIVCVFLYNKME